MADISYVNAKLVASIIKLRHGNCIIQILRIRTINGDNHLVTEITAVFQIFFINRVRRT